jgi:2-polyprenyl-6-methoxyphenol hydroxylase-like FAD-dependent oxidoreductase
LIELQNGDNLETKILIASDGNNSFIRQSLTFPTFSYTYDSKAIVTFVKTHKINDIAYQKFLENGKLNYDLLKDPLQCCQYT